MLAAPLDVVLPKGRKANTHGSPLSPSSSVVSHGRHVRGPFPTSVLLHTSPLHSSGLPHSLGRGFSTFTCLHSQPMAPLAAPTSLGALGMNLILTDLWKKASELGSGNQPEAGEKSSLEQITWLTAESKLTAQAWSDQPRAQKKLSPPHSARPSLSAAANGRQAGSLAPHRGTGGTGQQFQHRGPRRAQRPSPPGPTRGSGGSWLPPE